MTGQDAQAGLFGTLRRMLANALELAQVRLQLLGTEVELAAQRLVEGLLWGAMAVLVLGLGLVLLCGLLILLVQDAYRLAAVGVLALLFLVGGLWLLGQARQRIRRASGLFEASVAELRRDRAALSPNGQDGPG
jgi:uncharacterized membrane protein YqjE